MSTTTPNVEFRGDKNPAQSAFVGDTNTETAYVGGVGSGKTAAGVIRAMRHVTRWNPGATGAIVSPTVPMLRNVIEPELRKWGLLDRPGIEYRKSENRIEYENGATIILESANNDRKIERLRGLNLAWAWMDEAAYQPEKVYNVLSDRLRVGDYRNLFVTTTPRGFNWVYERFAPGDDAPDDATEPIADGRLYRTDTTTSVLGVSTRANPDNPDDYIARQERQRAGAGFDQEIEGEFVEHGAGLLTDDMITTVPASELEGRPLEWHVAVDLGVETDARKARENDTDYWALAIVAEDRYSGEAFLAEICRRRGQSPAQAAAWITGCIDWVPTDTVRYESVQAQSWFAEDLTDAGLAPVPVTPKANKERRIVGMSVPFSRDACRVVDWGDTSKDVDWSGFRSEWRTFPEGSHDDQLDAVEMALQPVTFGRQASPEGVDLYGRDLNDST